MKHEARSTKFETPAARSRFPRFFSNFEFRISNFRVVRGFTIIELLVVLAVIAVLASSITALFSTARAKSRDSRREADMNSIQSGLAIFATNARRYPVTDADGECLTGTDAISAEIVSSGAMAAVPTDPLQNCSGPQHYQYTSVDGTAYVVDYNLETNSIPGKSCGSPPCPQQVGP